MQLLGDALALLEQLETRQLLLCSAHLVVQPGVLDRDAGLCRQHDQRRLVVVGELRRPLLLGEVDVAEDLAQRLDRRPEERVHRRVVRWEAGRPRIGTDLGDAHRSPFPDQQPEDAVTHRQVPDRGSLLLGHALRDESLDAGGVLAEHAERSVTGPSDRHGQLHDPLEHGLEVELRCEGESSLDQHARASGVGRHARGRLAMAHHPSLATGSVRPVRWGAPDPGLERAPVLR